MPDTNATSLDRREDEITALVHRRAALRSEITRGRRDLQRLTFEFQRIDTAIRQLKGRSVASGGPPQAGVTSDITRILFEALNASAEPMTSHALAMRVMEELGMDTTDKTAAKHIVKRVCVCLWEQVQKGRFRQAQPNVRPLTWERVPITQ